MPGRARSHGCLPRSIRWSRRLSIARMATLLERDKSWYAERLPILEDRVRVRLGELSSRLGDADWLDGAFSAGDLLMVTVLRRLSGSGLLEKYPNLSAYVARGEARPAYKRAFDAQLAVFTKLKSQRPRDDRSPRRSAFQSVTALHVRDAQAALSVSRPASRGRMSLFKVDHTNTCARVTAAANARFTLQLRSEHSPTRRSRHRSFRCTRGKLWLRTAPDRDVSIRRSDVPLPPKFSVYEERQHEWVEFVGQIERAD